MSHNTVTHSPVDSMPRQSHLLKRGNIYHLNVRVPKDLLPLYGKTKIIRRSLGTADERVARQKLPYERVQLQTEFDEKRKTLRVPTQEKQNLHRISDQEAHGLVFHFFRQCEKESENWWEQDGSKLDDEQREQVLDNLQFDQAIYSGGIKRGVSFKESAETTVCAGDDASSQLDAFLKSEGLDCPKGSPAYNKLRSLFHRAVLENIQRDMDRHGYGGAKVHDSLFKDVFAHTAPPKVSITLGELVKQHQERLKKKNKSESTKKTYRTPSRLLCEVFGESTRLSEITKEEAERLLELLKRAPTNATKRYPGMTLEQAIAAADLAGDTSRLSRKSLENYFINLNSIFNFAVGRKLITENPFCDRDMREEFACANDETEKAHFFIDQLNTLFKAPLYTGCRNDETGYSKAGPNKPRRGRFWLPLISLLHGLRLTEAAQLFTEDVEEEDEIPYLHIRSNRADGSSSEKHLKTPQSKRRIPIHPELVRIGFLDFVASRRADLEHPRLFPELTSYKGDLGHNFSKWFRDFLDASLGIGCKATFHSFRHHFRTALGEAGVPLGDVEMLGGWESDGRSSEKRYDRATLKRLLSRIEAVKYEGLDLRHLYTQRLFRRGTRRRLRSA